MIRATLAAALVVIAIGCGKKDTPPAATDDNVQKEQKARENLEGPRVPPKRS